MTQPLTKEQLEDKIWTNLTSVATHAINCEDPKHQRQNSCVDFTEHVFKDIMQLITQREQQATSEKTAYVYTKESPSMPQLPTPQGEDTI